MTETNGTKYINEIAELYQVSEKDRSKLDGGYDKIQAAIQKYNWADIERAINHYFVHKNDKTRPVLAQILAILKTWQHEGKIEVFEPDDTDTQPIFTRPTTKIWSIQSSFNKMVDVFIDAGIIPNENGKYTNYRSLVDPKTDAPVLSPTMWLGWQLNAAEQQAPDLFARFPNTTKLEQIAIALQNGLIKLKVRDWKTKQQAMARYNINMGA